ncbi:hypothetical protein [Actinomadura sp. 21ATH]|uniref:hypothetical protein n=1 Tax=Actinomadura sp. 21ATH TaxID=1735444 RepID=UPI0035C21AFC
MLTLRLTPYRSTAWTWNSRGYVTGDGTSQVTPFPHPMVESLAITDGTRTALMVRERSAGRPATAPEPLDLSPAAFDRALTAAAAWPTDYVLVQTAPHAPVHVTTGAARTTLPVRSHITRR